MREMCMTLELVIEPEDKMGHVEAFEVRPSISLESVGSYFGRTKRIPAVAQDVWRGESAEEDGREEDGRREKSRATGREPKSARCRGVFSWDSHSPVH